MNEIFEALLEFERAEHERALSGERGSVRRRMAEYRGSPRSFTGYRPYARKSSSSSVFAFCRTSYRHTQTPEHSTLEVVARPREGGGWELLYFRERYGHPKALGMTARNGFDLVA